MKTYRSKIIMLFLTFLIAACSEEAQQQLNQQMKVLNIAYGDQNQLTVISDPDLWEGDLSDTIDYYYSAPYLILPQPEPLLDLRHFTPEDLARDPLRKELRAYLIVADLSSKSSPTNQLVKRMLGEAQVEKARLDARYNLVQIKDRWARDQIIIFQFGRNQKELVENLKKNNPLIIQKIKDHDKPKLEATVFLDDRNEELEREVYETFGIRMKIPKAYFKAIGDEDVFWIREEQDNISNNIFISKQPYQDINQISKSNIKSIRDTLGKFVSTSIEDTYMRINDQDLPMFTQTRKIDNKYALEARGIWEIVNDYMGGPFVSYLIHSPNKNELIFIDGFLHAPGEDKRNFMQYLEHIMETVQVP